MTEVEERWFEGLMNVVTFRLKKCCTPKYNLSWKGKKIWSSSRVVFLADSLVSDRVESAVVEKN